QGDPDAQLTLTGAAGRSCSGHGTSQSSAPSIPCRRACSSRTSADSRSSGPATGTEGATVVIDNPCTGGAGRPQLSSHWPSCAELAAYTIRPRPAQACAAAHIGQCSPEVYTVERA